MQRLVVCGVVVAALGGLPACFLLGGGGGGGGGTGGGSAVTFESGYVTIRKDDRNVVVTDERDVNAPVQLTSVGGASMPSFSKDGRQVVFARKAGQDSELMVVAVSGGAPTTILRSSPTQQNLRTPVFSPDGTRVAFAYDENSTSSSVGLVNVDGSNFRKVIGGGALAYSSPSWFPDGSALLVSAGNAGLMQTQVERVDVTSGAPTNVTNTLGTEVLAIASRLVISPDAKRAVFDGRVSSGVTRIFVLDLSTKVVTRQRTPASGAVNDSAPSWIDANTFVFSSDEGGNDQVYKQVVGAMSTTFAVPLAIEPAAFIKPMSSDAGVDGGVDGGP